MNTRIAPISTIIPMHNAAAFIAEAIASVAQQDPAPQEIIVVDDASRDDSVAVVEAMTAHIPTLVLLRQPKRGVAAAVNLGLTQASGEYLAFLDADDLWLPGKLARQLAAFAADPALDIVFGCTRQFIWQRDPTLGAVQRQDLPGVLVGAVRPTMLARRRVFDQVGVFNPDPHLQDFFDWYGRAQDAGMHMQVLPDVVHERRIHGTNEGIRDRDGQRHRQLHSLKVLLDRRRRAP